MTLLLPSWKMNLLTVKSKNFFFSNWTALSIICCSISMKYPTK